MKEHTKGLILGSVITLAGISLMVGMELAKAWENADYWDHWVEDQCSWSSRPVRCREVLCGVPKHYDWKKGMP